MEENSKCLLEKTESKSSMNVKMILGIVLLCLGYLAAGFSLYAFCVYMLFMYNIFYVTAIAIYFLIIVVFTIASFVSLKKDVRKISRVLLAGFLLMPVLYGFMMLCFYYGNLDYFRPYTSVFSWRL